MELVFFFCRREREQIEKAITNAMSFVTTEADTEQTERGRQESVLVGGEGVVLQSHEKYDEGSERAL